MQRLDARVLPDAFKSESAWREPLPGRTAKVILVVELVLIVASVMLALVIQSAWPLTVLGGLTLPAVIACIRLWQTRSPER